MSAARPDTWMPTYWGDYARDTAHLNATMHGAYLMLIKHYWCSGKPLPDDDAVLWRVATCDSPAQWRKLRPTIEPFFQIEGGEWHHKRVDAELERAVGFIKKQTQNGQKGGRPRKPDGEPDETQTGTQEKPTGKPNANPKITKSQSQSQSPKKDDYPNQQQRPEPARAAADEEAAIRRCYAELGEHWGESGPDGLNMPGLAGSTGAIRVWIREGADIERDIVPTLKATCLRMLQRGQKPRTFNLFTEDVSAAMRRNSAPLPESKNGHHHASNSAPGKPLSAGQRLLAELAGIAGADAGGSVPVGESEPGPVVDAEFVTVKS